MIHIRYIMDTMNICYFYIKKLCTLSPLQTSSRRVGWNQRQNLQGEDQYSCQGCGRNQQHQVIYIMLLENCDLSVNVV